MQKIKKMNNRIMIYLMRDKQKQKLSFKSSKKEYR